MGTECNFALGLADVLMIPWAFQGSFPVWASAAIPKARQAAGRSKIPPRIRMTEELIAKPPRRKAEIRNSKIEIRTSPRVSSFDFRISALRLLDSSECEQPAQRSRAVIPEAQSSLILQSNARAALARLHTFDGAAE
jgi:hypothetical protein